eukprot:Em0007g103a
MDTRLSMAAKVALTPAVVAGGVLATPFAGASLAAVGVYDKIEPETPVTKGLTGAASVFAGVGGAVAGFVGFPVGAVAAAMLLYDKGDESPRSDDDPE